MINIKKILFIVIPLLIIGLLTICIHYIQKSGIKVVYNGSESMPKGFYLLKPSKSYEVNDMVAFIPPIKVQEFLTQTHFAPKSGWLLKYVLGTPGDNACIYSNSVWVNNQKLGKVYNYYAPGKLLPKTRFCGTLHAHQYFLISNRVDRSFDGRYFGPVEDKNILGKAIPIFAK